MTATRRRGRPREPAIDQAVVAGAWQVLAEQGPRRLSPERVAATAGVAVSTVYRRFRSGDDVLLRLLHDLAAGLSVPDTGSVRGDMVELLNRLSDALSPAGPRRALVATWASAEDNTVVSEALDLALATWRQHAETIVDRAVRRGEISTHVNVTLIPEMLVSFALLRLVSTRSAPTPSALSAAVDLILSGVDPAQRPLTQLVPAQQTG